MRTLQLRAWRQEPEADGHLREYVVEVPPEGMVVDALFALLVQIDSSFAFRVSCRAGVCGSCAVRVDGRERLACQTPLSLVGSGVRIEPLRNLPIVKDLVVDLD
ncbi:succinate dehydrogenase and fumarate reductase iron-sulfur protein, partial [mine drainage metagenome]